MSESAPSSSNPLLNLFSSYAEYIGNRKILLVDDEQGVRKSLSLYLARCGFKVDEAENGLQAKDFLSSEDYFLVITDITMPEMDGLDLLKYIKTLDREMDVVMITGHMNIEFAIDAIKKGAFDYLKKPFMLEDVSTTITRILEKQTLKMKSLELERLKERQTVENRQLTEFMTALANVIDAKSTFTMQHSERVSEYSVRIATELALPEKEINLIALGARLHDVGKIATPDYILNKDGPLTKEEYDIIKEHPWRGAELIKPITSLQNIVDIVRHHHENNDGTGYPDGLEGDHIPFHARIVKIADYYDAVTSTRPYRKPMSQEQAAELLRDEAEKKRVEGEFVNALLTQMDLLAPV